MKTTHQEIELIEVTVDKPLGSQPRHKIHALMVDKSRILQLSDLQQAEAVIDKWTRRPVAVL